MELRLRGVKQLAGSIQPVLMEAVRGIHTQIMLLTAALCPQFQRLCFPRVWQVVALSSPRWGRGGEQGGRVPITEALIRVITLFQVLGT